MENNDYLVKVDYTLYILLFISMALEKDSQDFLMDINILWELVNSETKVS